MVRFCYNLFMMPIEKRRKRRGKSYFPAQGCEGCAQGIYLVKDILLRSKIKDVAARNIDKARKAHLAKLKKNEYPMAHLDASFKHPKSL